MYQKLRRLFTDLTAATLALQATGCGDDEISRRDFSELSCDTGAWLTALRVSTDAGYLAIRRSSVDRFEGGTSPVATWSYLTESGTPCAGSTDTSACNDALEAAIEAHEQPPADMAFELFWTRGDQVGAISTRSELAAFLGTIDGPEEAALIARFADGADLYCEGANVRTTSAGVQIITRSGFACGRGTELLEHLLLIAPDGTSSVQQTVVIEVGDPNCAIGRMTSGLAMPPKTRHADLGSYFAEMAALERAAIVAFERLARELEALGAPRSLVQRALDAAEDEARHTRAVTELTRDFGGVVPREVPHAALPLRPALDIAIENATEGCVRETYGALVATHQARTASDPRIRRALARIALDETQHAAFSWELAAWLDTALEADERAYVDAMRRESVGAFRGSLGSDLPDRAREAAGLPDEKVSRALFAGLEQSVWGTAS